MSKLYYIQCTAGAVGDSVLWWRKGGKGYTLDLEEAEVVAESELGRFTRDIDVPRAKDAMDRLARRHVHRDDLFEWDHSRKQAMQRELDERQIDTLRQQLSECCEGDVPTLRELREMDIDQLLLVNETLRELAELERRKRDAR